MSGSNNNEHSSEHQVRIVQNSDSDLQALFDSVLKPDSKRPLQVPWSMRNLPNSFFTPPSTGSKSPSVLSISHSRENSADSAFGTNTTPAGLQVCKIGRELCGIRFVENKETYSIPDFRVASNQVCALQVNHPRAHSSPASLQQTYASAQQPLPQAPQIHSHAKQRSYDLSAPNSSNDDLGPLPLGWEQAKTPQGQVYYLK